MTGLPYLRRTGRPAAMVVRAPGIGIDAARRAGVSLPLLVLLVGCRQVLGIPSGGSVDDGESGFRVLANVRGADEARLGQAIVTVNGEPEELVDGMLRIGPALADGDDYTIVATTPSCTVTAGPTGRIEGADGAATIVCDGLAAVGDFGFSAPLDFDPSFDPAVDAPMLLGSVLTQETYFAPTPAHSDASPVMTVRFDGTPQAANPDGRYGPFPFAPNMLFGVDVQTQAFGRTYTLMPQARPPALFGRGKPATVAPGEAFGSSVAAFEDVLAVGAPEVGAGRVVVFRRSGRAWVEEATFTGTADGDRFGASVAVAGDRIVVGAPAIGRPGSAHVFVRSGNTWSAGPVRQATAPAADDEYGAAVAITATHVFVGAPAASVVFEYPPAGAALARAGAAGDRFGASLAVGGNALVVGAPGEDGSGAAHVFAVGSASGVALRPRVPGIGDAFGAAVATDGATVAVGAPFEDSNAVGVDDTADPGDDLDAGNNAANASGAAYLFAVNGTQLAYIKAPNADVGDNFGTSVALLRHTVGATTTCVLAIGAPYEDSRGATGDDPLHDESAPDAGAVYAYAVDVATRRLSVPDYVKADAEGGTSGDALGLAIALTPESLVAGAPYEDSSTGGWNSAGNEQGLDAGAVLTFR